MSAAPISASEVLDDDAFSRISAIALKDAGLVLPNSKKTMVESRISRRMRAVGCANISDYLSKLSGPDEAFERRELISTLTTNVTSFFREIHHFETLRQVVLPELVSSARAGRKIRFWSAGSSSGQEAFSLAMLLVWLEPNIADLDVRILATDIDHAIIERAKTATYENAELESVPKEIRATASLAPASNGMVTMPDSLRKLVTFKRLNLHERWPMRGQFDVVLCRNVVIYFDAAHQASLWPRFNSALKDQGWLFLGHSERIHPLENSGFQPRGVTTYQKTGAWSESV